MSRQASYRGAFSLNLSRFLFLYILPDSIIYLCYMDESGTSDIPGNTSHFILAGLSIPISRWRDCDSQLDTIKKKYDLSDAELHVAWLRRPYVEQNNIPNFAALDYRTRRSLVESERKKELYRLQRLKKNSQYKQTRKNYKKTEHYTHLTFDEREELIKVVATCVANWSFARLFAECVNKIYFDPTRSPQSIDEQSFEQVVSRFEQYLKKIQEDSSFGLLIHDNNETVARKHTQLMKQFHQQGTLWTAVENIVETPLFVDS